MIAATELARWQRALPFAISFLTVPLLVLGARMGGLWLALVPLYAWYMFPVFDLLTGTDDDNADLETPETRLFWYRLITRVWFPIQVAVIFGSIYFATHTGHLDTGEKLALFLGVGVISGSVGINFAHELMHQRGRLDRWLADLLLSSVLYSHFRSEHLVVHHSHVGTPRDTVTAAYGEGFYRFYARVLPGSFRSALAAEAERLQQKNRSPWDLANPFWRYATLQYAMLFLAGMVGGIEGMLLFLFQAFIAITELELVNYVEHYGLRRQMRADGRWEPVGLHHSWNAAQRASNWYLINLQRHSDHHAKPTRPFPLLQTYSKDKAPALPVDYALMTLAAFVPPLFRKIMNPRVREWRKQFYPDVTDWSRAAWGQPRR